MHTGARLYKILLLENKATCKVMNLIKLVHRHLNANNAGTIVWDPTTLGQAAASTWPLVQVHTTKLWAIGDLSRHKTLTLSKSGQNREYLPLVAFDMARNSTMFHRGMLSRPKHRCFCVFFLTNNEYPDISKSARTSTVVYCSIRINHQMVNFAHAMRTRLSNSHPRSPSESLGTRLALVKRRTSSSTWSHSFEDKSRCYKPI